MLNGAGFLQGKHRSFDINKLRSLCTVTAVMEAILVHSCNSGEEPNEEWKEEEWKEACSIVEPIAATALLIGDAMQSSEGAASFDANMQSILRKCQQAMQGVFSLLLVDHLLIPQQENMPAIVHSIFRPSLLA